MHSHIPFRAPIPYVKTTGHITAALLVFVLFLVIAALFSPTPAAAADFHLIVANDPIFGNKEGDNLYTAGLGVEVQRGYRVFQGGERMFTDREVGQRFDETYLSLEQRLKSWGAWEPTLGFGVLHIGHGLLGQSVQNQIHQAIGSETFDFDYPARNKWFGELMAKVERSDLFGGGRLLTTAIELRTAPGFRSWLRAMASYEAPFGKHFSWRAGAGVHAEDASYALLEKNVEKVAPAGELGIAWRALTLTWTYNALGTASSHLILGMNVPLKVLDGAVASAARRH